MEEGKAPVEQPIAAGVWTVEQALSTVHPPLDLHPVPDSPIPFFHLLERLKTTKREGWRRFAITDGESIADHMYRMAIMTMLCPPALSPHLDLARCTQMALIHDMAEALVGDITPVDGISKTEKSRRESATMAFFQTRMLGGVRGGGATAATAAAATAAPFLQVWQEYEDGETLEARFVHDVDKVELLLQMVEYEKRHEGTVDLGEFARTARRVELPAMRSWCRDILEERASFWKGQGREASYLDVDVS